MEKPDERITERRRFLREVTNELSPLLAERGERFWELSTTGQKKAATRFAAAKVAAEKALADPERYLTVRRFEQDGPCGDASVDRQLDVLRRMLVRGQADATKIES